MHRDEQPIIGESPAFLSMLEQVSRAAALNRPVLVVGERGTGKELIAERLHYLSPRWDQPLVRLNCAAINEALLESELFGHESGAFTDARGRRTGRFELADSGSLFLDELATTSVSVQEKILRIVEYGEFERLGSSKTLRVDVRVIGATNEDLPALADQNRFRADLLDRLSFEVITLPPMRERREDIGLLAEHFAIRMSREMGREVFAGFSDRAREQMLAYAWPGNVRELKNTVERAVYRLEEIEQPIEKLQLDPFDSPFRPQPSGQDQNPSSTGDRAAPESNAEQQLPIDLKQHLQDIEIEWIERALHEQEGNQRRAAKQLGLSYDQLRGLLRKYEIS